MSSFWYLLVFAIALVVTAVITPLTIKVAKHFNIIDYPDGRRINEKPVPRLGGIALYLGILISFVALFFFYAPDVEGIRHGLTPNINYFGVALSATVIFAVGLIDDFRTIRVRYKLIGQIVAAIIACLSGVLFSRIASPNGGPFIELGLFAYPITVFYLVAFANIINLIDGLDGLAAGIAAISSAALFVIAIGKGGFDVALVTLAIAGSCIAFLRYNSYPARIFMGDAGALLLGFLLGLVSLFGVVRTPAFITLAVPIVVAGIPVIDTFSAIVRRLRAGRSVVDADTKHIHHRILEIGYDQQTTVYILYVFSGLLALCALLLTRYTGWIRWAIALVLIGMMFILIIRLRLTDPVLKHYYNKRASDQQASEDNTDKRPESDA